MMSVTDADEARYLARVGNLVDTFLQIAKNEHRNVVADAALAFLAEALANHPSREEMVQHVLEHLPTIVDDIIAAELREPKQGSA
jgi:seryl-tRNA(Sec) selenium transferase